VAGVAGVADPASEGRDHPFRSHLTLGRVRRGDRAPSLEAPRPTQPAPTRVDEIVLFQSELSRTGASYTQLERIPLARRN
jgi:2'-5' RNA ligase